MKRVAILGSTGMLGSTLTQFMENDSHDIIEFNRTGKSVTGNNKAVEIDVLNQYDLLKLFAGLEIDFLINAIGMIKQVIDERNKQDILAAQKINSEFLQDLNLYSLASGTRIIQIGTDCVYSGIVGPYSEDSLFDPTDVYGKTKTVGEQASTESMIIRCSIIGRELIGTKSLLEWVLSQPVGARINGFANHFWNGVTALQFSEIVSGVIKSDGFKKGVIHLVPSDVVSKYQLVKLIADSFGRKDLQICEFMAESPINRALVTVDPTRNLHMWRSGGYTEVPSIQDMVSRYAQWTKAN
jgi:dTDP-4-dehydrorhamnose reductase